MHKVTSSIDVGSQVHREVLQLRLIGKIAFFDPSVTFPEISQTIGRLPGYRFWCKFFGDVYYLSRHLFEPINFQLDVRGKAASVRTTQLTVKVFGRHAPESLSPHL